MFERFTDRARTVVVLAQEEARDLGHNYIGTEHLLLGVLAEPTGLAGEALRGLGVSAEEARAAVNEIIGRGADAPSGHIPFTPRAKKVLELALREALALGHNYIGTEHILLGLVREGEGVAAQVLVTLGADLSSVRGQVMQMLGAPVQPMQGGRRIWTPRARPFTRPFTRRVPPPGAAPWETPLEPWEWPVTPGVARVQAASRALDKPVGTDHLLRALAETPDTVAAKVFESLGLTPEQIVAAIDATPRTGTTDEIPSAPRRAIRVEEEEGRLVIEIEGDAVGEMRDAILDAIRGLAPDDPPAPT